MGYVKIIFLGFSGGAVALFLFVFTPLVSGPLVFNLIKSSLVEYVDEKPAPEFAPITTPAETRLSTDPFPEPDFWQKIVSDGALSTVAIQSFKSGKIVREGGGIIVSSDGVVITTLDVISGADVLQIFNEDKILRAQVIRYDGFKNLALIKINTSNMNVARFDRNYQFQPGQDVVVSGKLVELSNPSVFAQKGIVNRVFSKDVILDVEPNYFLSGSKVINSSGIVVGMTYLRNGFVYLIKAETMDDFAKNYFESLK